MEPMNIESNEVTEKEQKKILELLEIEALDGSFKKCYNTIRHLRQKGLNITHKSIHQKANQRFLYTSCFIKAFKIVDQEKSNPLLEKRLRKIKKKTIVLTKLHEPMKKKIAKYSPKHTDLSKAAINSVLLQKNMCEQKKAMGKYAQTRQGWVLRKLCIIQAFLEIPNDKFNTLFSPKKEEEKEEKDFVEAFNLLRKTTALGIVIHEKKKKMDRDRDRAENMDAVDALIYALNEYNEYNEYMDANALNLYSKKAFFNH